jgi:hypothetical protein
MDLDFQAQLTCLKTWKNSFIILFTAGSNRPELTLTFSVSNYDWAVSDVVRHLNTPLMHFIFVKYRLLSYTTVMLFKSILTLLKPSFFLIWHSNHNILDILAWPISCHQRSLDPKFIIFAFFTIHQKKALHFIKLQNSSRLFVNDTLVRNQNFPKWLANFVSIRSC